jgi:O-antigen/teichoic acid export membrane protein/nucleoside-diphosphate-sugar epimerase
MSIEMDNDKSIACVTGASGVIGRRIVSLLLVRGYTVRTLSRRSQYPMTGVEHFCGDLRDEAVLRTFVSGADFMFHCAAELNDETIMWEVNVHGTEKLVSAVKNSGIEYFCFLSSAGVVGKTDLKTVDERTPCNPQTPYEASKWEAEKIVTKGINGCRTVILRPTNVFDKGRLGALQSLFVNPVISRASVFIKGGESAHFLHAIDVADAAIFFLSNAAQGEQLYFVSRDDEPLNTYAGIWQLLHQKQSEEEDCIKGSTKYLSLSLLKIIRYFFFPSNVLPEMKISSNKLRDTGLKYSLSFPDAIKKLSSEQAPEPNQSRVGERLMSESLWALLGKVSGTAFNLFVNALLARLLSVEEMGGYFITLSIVMFASVFAQFGLNYAVVRIIAETLALGKGQKAIRSIIFIFKFAGGGITFVMFFIAFKGGFWFSKYIFDSVLIAKVSGVMSIWIVVFAFQHLMVETFRGFSDIRLAAIFGGIMPSLIMFFFTAGVWIASGTSDLHQVIELFIFAGSINICLAGYFLWKKCKEKWKDSAPSAISSSYILKMAWPMWITNLMMIILAQSDLWILGILGNGEWVALYAASSRLAILISAPLLIINAVVPPHVAELYARKRRYEMENILRVVASFSGIFGFILFLLYALFGKFILSIVYGENYAVGSTLLYLLSTGQFVLVWGGASGIVLMMTGHQVSMMVITGFSGMLSVLLAIGLIGKYGTTGVAAATALGSIIQSVCMVIAVKRKLNVWTPMYTPHKPLLNLFR